MKRLLIYAVLISCVLLLFSGCSAITERYKNYLDEKIQQESGILEDKDYLDYKGLEEEGKLNEEGTYSDSAYELGEPEEKAGVIHVTFAKNSFLNVSYYSDPELRNRIDEQSCYLNPGDCVYASEPKTDSPYSSQYVFVRFRVWDCGESGKRALVGDEFSGRDNNLVMAIPSGYTGTELAVEPIGKYEDRELTLTDSYTDDGGNLHELNGLWYVDGRETRSTSLKISPITPYTVIYDYSELAEEYYYVDSTPTCFSQQEGIVQFREAQALDTTGSYSVRLHRYISVKVTNTALNILSAITQSNSIITSISINGEKQPLSSETEQSLPKMKCGDQIIIRVGKDYKVTAGELESEEPVLIEGNWEYTLTVPQSDKSEFSITVSKITATLGGFEQKTIPNASISVTRSDGSVISDGDEVSDSEKITVTITPSAGYYITGKRVKDNVYQDTMKYSKYVSDIDGIIENHPVVQYVTVTLVTEAEHGICVFKLNGEEVSGTVQVQPGEKLKLEYTLTDEAYEYEREGAVTQFFGSIKDKFTLGKTVTIEITPELNGTEIRGESYVSIKKK